MTIRQIAERITFREILEGLRVTFRHIFAKEVTLQYPREKLSLPSTHRGALCLLRYEDGEERCVGCDLCEAACPSHCIRVVSAEAQENGVVRRYATAFDIDMTKCVFCGFCVEACPVNALGMTKLYAYSSGNKRSLIFDKQKLYEVGETYYTEAKSYLVAHNQEPATEAANAWRYRFPPHFHPNAVSEPLAAATATTESGEG